RPARNIPCSSRGEGDPGPRRRNGSDRNRRRALWRRRVRQVDRQARRRPHSEDSSGRIHMTASRATVEALMYSLGERGTAALQEHDTRRRLSQLDREQVIEVATRLMMLKPEIALAWGDEQVKELYAAKATL